MKTCSLLWSKPDQEKSFRMRGLLDFEEASNQWFRGPTKAMTTDELQKVIDSNLKIVGSGGKFRITVARGNGLG